MSAEGCNAFPLATGWVETTGDRGQKIVVVRELDRGMSLRDYFAAAAMQGLIAAGFASVPEGETGDDTNDYVAGRAYYIAEAMLVARDAK